MKPASKNREMVLSKSSSFRRPGILACGRWAALGLLAWLCPAYVWADSPSVAGSMATYESDKVDQAPVLKKAVRLRFSSAAKRQGAEITLRFLVKTDGTVDRITVVKFTDAEMIDPVYSAYEKALFEPGQIKGVPVGTWLTVTEKAE